MYSPEQRSGPVLAAVKYLLGGCDPFLFVERFLGREPLVGRVPDVPLRLYSLEALSRALSFEELHFPRVRLARNDVILPPERCFALDGTGRKSRPDAIVPVDVGRIVQELNQGATLAFDRVDAHTVELTAHLMLLDLFFDSQMSVNAYYSTPPAAGFGLHYDSHDVFILQIEGRKDWELFAPTVLHPTRVFDQSMRPDVDPGTVVRLTLEEGQTLYLPRGWWHRAKPRDVPSLHLTFSLERPTYASLLAGIAEDLTMREGFREDVPFAAGAEAAARVAEDLGRRLDGALNDERVARFGTRRRAVAPARPCFSLRDQMAGASPLEAGTRLAWLPPQSLDIATDTPGEAMTFRALSRTFTMTTSAEPIIAFARHRRFFSVAQAVHACGSRYGSDEVVVDFIGDLIGHGLLARDSMGLHRWADMLCGTGLPYDERKRA